MKVIKKYFIKRIIVSSMSLFLILLFILVPTKSSIKKTINNDNLNNSIYLIDKDNYVSRVNYYYDTKSIEDEIHNKLELLKTGINNFSGVITSDIIINNIKVDKNNVYIDFNDKFLNIKDKTKIYESIVFSLTEINGVDNIFISVNNKMLDNMPLDRSIGINKKYNLNNFESVDKTIVFFAKEDYYVPITMISNSEDDKINIIIKELKSSINALNNLNGYLSSDVELINYEIDKDKIELVFNKFIFDDERVKFLLTASVFENYNVNKIVLYNSDKSVSISIKK